MAPVLPGPSNPRIHSPYRLLPCAAVPGHVRANSGSPTPTPWARPPRLLACCPYPRRLEIKLTLFHMFVCAPLWALREGTTTPHAVRLDRSSPLASNASPWALLHCAQLALSAMRIGCAVRRRIPQLGISAAGRSERPPLPLLPQDPGLSPSSCSYRPYPASEWPLSARVHDPQGPPP